MPVYNKISTYIRFFLSHKIELVNRTTYQEMSYLHKLLNAITHLSILRSIIFSHRSNSQSTILNLLIPSDTNEFLILRKNVLYTKQMAQILFVKSQIDNLSATQFIPKYSVFEIIYVKLLNLLQRYCHQRILPNSKRRLLSLLLVFMLDDKLVLYSPSQAKSPVYIYCPQGHRPS